MQRAPDPRPVRLPYYSKLEAEFGVDQAAWRVLVEATFPSAKTVEAVWMALAYCKQRKLDPFKRCVHIVPMYSPSIKRTIETVWPGIGELRTTAFRTKQYAGMDAAEVGPALTEDFKGTSSYEDRFGREKSEIREATVTFAEWMRVTVYRMNCGQKCKFVGPKVYWKETYGRWKGTEVPNDRWCMAPNGQLEKCAEAAALRNAFPEELGNEYAAEEMEDRTLISEMEPCGLNEPPNPIWPPKLEHSTPAATVPAPAASPVQPNVQVNEEVADAIISQFKQFAETAKNIDELLEFSELHVDRNYDLWPKEKQIAFDREFRLAADSLPEPDAHSDSWPNERPDEFDRENRRVAESLPEPE